MNEQENKVYYDAYMKVGRLGIEPSKVVSVCDLLMDKNLMNEIFTDPLPVKVQKMTFGIRVSNLLYPLFAVFLR